MKKFTLIVLFVLLATLMVGFMSGRRDDSIQPIAYNHYKHVEEMGMECLDCHKYAEENARASIPNIEVCVGCHEEAISDSEEELTLLGFIKENKKIPWRQICTVPDHAYFSHRRHVTLGKIECAVCHGEVGNLTVPVSKPHVNLEMEWCIDCHEQRGVSNDCYACHR